MQNYEITSLALVLPREDIKNNSSTKTSSIVIIISTATTEVVQHQYIFQISPGSIILLIEKKEKLNITFQMKILVLR